jgi:CDP-glycerol glycerophosphotransferase (TagB/SpsB family)
MNTNLIFANICNLYGRLFKVNNNQVTLIEKHNTGFTGNLYDISIELKRQNPDSRINIIYNSDYNGGIKGIGRLLRLFTIKAALMMKSKYIFLNDNFMPLAYIKLNKNTSVTQIWHGIGAFKKFGISSIDDIELIDEVKKVNKNVDTIVVSSKNVIDFYAEAFGVKRNKVKALGIPQADFYFKKHDILTMRQNFLKTYPECAGKKIILYAPTFRDNPEADRLLLQNFDFDKFNKELSDDYQLLVRLHPQVHTSVSKTKGIINVTDFPSIRTLLLLSDILIADYSSVAVEFALLNKPIVLYPYDYEDFINNDRGFYFDYLSQAPGPICYNMDSLISCIKNKKFDLEKGRAFASLHNDFTDGSSTKRIVNYVKLQNP